MQPAIRHSFVSFPRNAKPKVCASFHECGELRTWTNCCSVNVNVTDKVRLFLLLTYNYTYTYKLKTYIWNVIPHSRNCLFVHLIDAQAGILLPDDR